MEAEAHPSAGGERRATAAGLLEFVSRHALLLIVVGGAAVRFGTLGSQGFWFDERGAISVITLQPSEMLQRILITETSPPLYFLVAWAWKAVFGLGEVGLRSLSALAGTATIPVVYAVGRDLASRRAGLLAAALTATSPFLIWYSQEARPYALFTFLAALAFLCFVRALQDVDSRWLWAWALCSILAFTTHYFGLLLTAIEAAWLLWRMRGRRAEVVLATATAASPGVVLVPLALAQRYIAVWINGIPVGERLLQIPEHFIVGLESPWGFLPLLIVVVVAAVVYAATRADGGTIHAAALPAGVMVAAIAVPLGAMVIGKDYLLSRNLIGIWPLLAIALAVLLAAPAARRLGTIVVTGMCAAGLALAVWTAATPAAGRPDWEPLAAALGTPHLPRLIEYPTVFTWAMPLDQHLPNARDGRPGERGTVREVDVIRPRRVRNYSIGPCWWLGFCGGQNMLGPLDRPPFPIPKSFKLVAKGHASLFTYRRYLAPHPVKVPTTGFFGPMIVQAPS